MQDKQWQPKLGEGYWSIGLDGYSRYTWTNIPIERLLLKHGNIFRTKEDAILYMNKLSKRIK